MHYQFGLVQDLPASPISYQCEGTISMNDVQPLNYVSKPDPTQEEVLVEDDIREDDVGIIKAFSTWW